MKEFCNFIVKDVVDNKKYIITLLLLLLGIFLPYHFVSYHDDIYYYYDDLFIRQEFSSKFYRDARLIYPIVTSFINKLYLTHQVVLFIGFFLFCINNFVLIKLFFPQLGNQKCFVFSSLLMVNPFIFEALNWSSMFLSVQIGIFLLYFFYYLYLHSNLNIFLKGIILSLGIWIAMNIMPSIIFLYITLLFSSIFFNFLLNRDLSLKKIFLDNYFHLIYIFLGLIIYIIIDKSILHFIYEQERVMFPWRGEYSVVSSWLEFFKRVKDISFFIKNNHPIYFYSFSIFSIFLLLYVVFKQQKAVITSILFFFGFVVLFFLPFSTEIIMNITGTNVKLISLHYLIICLFIITLSLFTKKSWISIFLYSTYIVYFILSVSVINRVSNVNEAKDRINRSIYDKVVLESYKYSNGISNQKIYLYGRFHYPFSLYSQREMKIINTFSFYPYFLNWAEVQGFLEFYLQDIGYSNIISIYKYDITDKKIKNSINNKVSNKVFFPEKDSIFSYNGNIYVIFSE